MAALDQLLSTIESVHSAGIGETPWPQALAAEQGIALMRTLLPHVRQAFDVARRLRGAATASRDIERALDALRDGAALVKADGTIAFANAAFAAIARRHDGITVRKDTPVLHYALALAAILRLRDGDPTTLVRSGHCRTAPAGCAALFGLGAPAPGPSARRRERSRRAGFRA